MLLLWLLAFTADVVLAAAERLGKLGVLWLDWQLCVMAI